MAKGDDAMTRKKNKSNRKKLNRKNQDGSSKVSSRVASLIAAKKRRKAGKRSKCQGMCFSLPTPDDPFNDGHGKKDFNTQKTKKKTKLKTKTVQKNNLKADNGVRTAESSRILINEEKSGPASTSDTDVECEVELGGLKINIKEKTEVKSQQPLGWKISDGPSKFFILCLKTIEESLWPNEGENGNRMNPLFSNAWGIEFWKLYAGGKDILETSGANLSLERIAWVASAAADTIARKEKEGLSISSPFLLYLVPSKEKANQVRSVCKPLKALGIHTVSIHSGAPLDHQINGLKSCEPEFLISTPERLLELISLKAIDISGVSLLVIDGREILSDCASCDKTISIRQYISGNPQTWLFSDYSSYPCIPAVQNLMKGSVRRLSSEDTIRSLSSCIIQHVNVCSSEEEKLLKVFQVLDMACRGDAYPRKILYVVWRDEKFNKLVAALKKKGYAVSSGLICNTPGDANNLTKPAISVINAKEISHTDIGDYDVVMMPDFVQSINTYVHVLTKMARYTVRGILESFFTKDNAELANPLVEILDQCGQAIPHSLRELSPEYTTMEE